MTEYLSFTVDTKDLKGKNVVVFEKLYFGDILIADHEDVNDDFQTISFADGGTEAGDKESKSKIIAEKENSTIVDKVKYKNLLPGKAYTLKAVLMDKSKGTPILNEKGEELLYAMEFTPEEKDGTVDFEIEVSHSLIKGKTIVIFEECLYENTAVFIHADIDDKEQTVYAPEIRTYATYENKEKKTILSDKETVIFDRVVYKGLEPGKKYTFKGSLMLLSEKDSAEDKMIADVAVEFTAEKSDSELVIEFRPDNDVFKNRTGTVNLVVYEELYLSGETKACASHIDRESKDQSIYLEIPKEPEKPTTPKVPETPDTPATPEKPEKPEIPNSPETSDSFSLMYFIMAFASLLSMSVIRHKKKKA